MSRQPYVASVCDDSEAEGPDDDDGQDEDSLCEDAELFAELFGSDSLFDEEEADEDRPLTPGERVFYALGQLHRLHLAGRYPVHPKRVVVKDVARIVGAAGELEFITEDHRGQHFHFPTEVLEVNNARPFPWRLLTAWDWAAEQEAGPARREGDS